MSNPNAPFGFMPCTKLGAPYNGALMRVYFPSTDATAAFKGSLVKLTGAVASDGFTPVVTVASPSDGKIAGSVVSFAPQIDGNFTVYNRPASTAGYAFIPRDPSMFYMVQEDSVGGNIAVTTAIGQNCDFTAESSTATNGVSNMQLDSSTAANTNTLPIRLIGPSLQTNNDPTTASSNGNWIVAINLSDLTNTTGT